MMYLELWELESVLIVFKIRPDCLLLLVGEYCDPSNPIEEAFLIQVVWIIHGYIAPNEQRQHT